eukprot:5896926-Amphidinium_carterae.1
MARHTSATTHDRELETKKSPNPICANMLLNVLSPTKTSPDAVICLATYRIALKGPPEVCVSFLSLAEALDQMPCTSR